MGDGRKQATARHTVLSVRKGGKSGRERGEAEDESEESYKVM